MLDPDNRDMFLPRLLDKAADVRHDRIALVTSVHGGVLDIDDEQRGGWPVAESCHGLPFWRRCVSYVGQPRPCLLTHSPIRRAVRDSHGHPRTGRQACRLGLRSATPIAETSLIRKRSEVQVF